MSLFPAYAQDDPESSVEMQVKHVTIPEMSPAREEQLLASDEETPSPPPPAPPSPPVFHDTFYLDPKSDYGNLRVSTLYYPGRPQYASRSSAAALGGSAPAGRARKRRRYFEGAPVPPAPPLDDELAPRVAAFRAMLADAPGDVELWLKFIRFQEQCSGLGAALETAAEACARADNAALRRERHRLARLHLPAHHYLAALRDDVAAEKSVSRRAELWLFLLETLAASPARCSAHALRAAAAAAAHDVAAAPSAYPHLLFAYGRFLRAAGLWELLVLLIELVASMSFPPTTVFPPPSRDEDIAAMEEKLLRVEDEVAASGLPLAARWVRVERARAAAHWRAPAHASQQDLQADPQRAPLAADVTDLLLPVAGPDAAFLLAAQLLRLAKIPMLPGGEYVRRAFSCGAADTADDCAEALLVLLRARRRLPPAHPAHAAHVPHAAHVAHAAHAPHSAQSAHAARPAARLLAALLDPPHYTSRQSGFLEWVQALWDACCGWAAGERRVALLCWRLRWMHALALLIDTDEQHGKDEIRRMRKEARSALRSFADASPLPFAQFARLELLACGGAAGSSAARQAARAALSTSDLPVEQRLYVARVAAEMPAPHGPGLWPVACAVVGRPLPPDAELQSPPPPELIERALRLAEERCDQLESEFERSEPEDDISGGARVLAALLPGAGEWAAARALLAPPARRRQLLARVAAARAPATQSWLAGRYWEQAGAALTATAAQHHGLAAYARRLAARYPSNALLALASSGGNAWTAGGLTDGADVDVLRRTEVGALAEILPPLLRAVQAWESADSSASAVASRVALRTCRRVVRAGGGGGGGACAWAALVECAARADCAALAPPHALLAAVDACPAHKWLYVRGAAWGGDAAAADAALDRQLRLHALPDELAACDDVPAASHNTPPARQGNDTRAA